MLGRDFGAGRAQLFGLGAIEKPVVQLGGADAALGKLVLAVPMAVDADRGGGGEVGGELAEEICGAIGQGDWQAVAAAEWSGVQNPPSAPNPRPVG